MMKVEVKVAKLCCPPHYPANPLRSSPFVIVKAEEDNVELRTEPRPPLWRAYLPFCPVVRDPLQPQCPNDQPVSRKFT